MAEQGQPLITFALFAYNQERFIWGIRSVPRPLHYGLIFPLNFYNSKY